MNGCVDSFICNFTRPQAQTVSYPIHQPIAAPLPQSTSISITHCKSPLTSMATITRGQSLIALYTRSSTADVIRILTIFGKLVSQLTDADGVHQHVPGTWPCISTACTEESPLIQMVDLACFTLEIHHGGYWMHLDNERRKYKGGSVHYLDGVDPETCSWVECNNMAYDLGYRVRPISYWYKLPRMTKSEGFYPIRNDVDAVQMTRHIPPKKRVMELYITGCGRRQIKEAELDDKIPKPNGWHNPLNTLLASELVKQKHVNMVASHHVNVTDDLNDDVAVTNNVEDVTLYDDVAENEVKGDTNGYVADDDFNVDPTPADNAVLEKEILEDEAAQALRKKKGEYNTRYKGEKSVGEGDLEHEITDEEDKDFFIDSEFEQSEEDDEIFFEKEVEEPNVIEEFQEMGYAGEISDDVKGSDADLTSLEGSGSEEDENGKMVPVNKEAERKFKKFHQEVDMRNPVFEIGMKLPNTTVLKNAIREYSVLNKKKVWFELNRRFKVQAKCGWNRPAHKKYKKAPKQDRKKKRSVPLEDICKLL
ncbi:hypothetical protein M0R45_006497 [Rubus argutus]|uniref:PB1-like domain-containing protein n=1 Tax=Rubus argutus TaxID=59490 RepID=A0AAW1YQQ6_RUBAR